MEQRRTNQSEDEDMDVAAAAGPISRPEIAHQITQRVESFTKDVNQGYKHWARGNPRAEGLVKAGAGLAGYAAGGTAVSIGAVGIASGAGALPGLSLIHI